MSVAHEKDNFNGSTLLFKLKQVEIKEPFGEVSPNNCAYVQCRKETKMIRHIRFKCDVMHPNSCKTQVHFPEAVGFKITPTK